MTDKRTDTDATKRRHTQWTFQEIQQFFKRARRAYQSPELDIRLAPQQYPPWGHLLIVAPRAMGNAPQRNLFKRRIRALFHELDLEKGGYDIAIFAKVGITKLSFADLKAIVLRVCAPGSA